MLAGSHDFKFECTLPSEIPGSYEASQGSIEYKVVVKADVPWAIDDEIKQKFTIVRDEDLNLHTNAFFPIKNEKIQQFCVFQPMKMGCGSETCLMTVSIPQSGYVPGQILCYRLEIHSKSKISIFNTRAALRQVITYLSDVPNTKTLVDPSLLTPYQVMALTKNGDFYSYEGAIEIPSESHPSNDHCCRVLKVSYDLLIEADIDGVLSRIQLKTPIIIGTIPIRSDSRMRTQSPLTIASVPTISELHPHNSSQPGRYNGELFCSIGANVKYIAPFNYI